MPEIDPSLRRFDIPGLVRIEPPSTGSGEPGRNGLSRVVVTTPQAEAHVYLHGAHVTHFQPRGQAPVLFLSEKSHFAAGKAIRGGVPLIFPWFGPKADDPVAPAHGVARTADWKPHDSRQNSDGSVCITFALNTADTDRKWWSADFQLLYTVSVGHVLGLTLEVRNLSSAPFCFEEALHTYLAVADVRQVEIEGLSGRTYIDKVDGSNRKTQDGPIRIAGETDRVYLHTPDTVIVRDPTAHRRLIVSKEGSNATVVWNPWIAKAKAMSDFGDEEWPRMLCIETANAADNAVTLPPGDMHRMRAIIRVESL